MADLYIKKFIELINEDADDNELNALIEQASEYITSNEEYDRFYNKAMTEYRKLLG